MLTIQQTVVEQFLAELAKSKEVTKEQVQQLRQVMTSGKKVKSDEYVNIFIKPTDEEVA